MPVLADLGEVVVTVVHAASRRPAVRTRFCPGGFVKGRALNAGSSGLGPQNRGLAVPHDQVQPAKLALSTAQCTLLP